MQKLKRKVISLEEKFEILKNGHKSGVITNFDLNESTIQTIKQNEQRNREIHSGVQYFSKKKNKKSLMISLEENSFG